MAMGEIIIKTYVLDVGDIDEVTFNKCYQSFKQYRKDKIDNLKFEKNKLLSLGAEVLIQEVCKDFDIDYNSLELQFNEYGKPYFKNSDIFFNTSHSGTKVMCIASTREVGCDIQEMKEVKFDIAKRFFTPRETELVSVNNEAFFSLWSLKEAILKCMGCGLAKPLNSIDLADISEDQSITLNNQQYHFAYQIFEDYMTAIAIKGEDKIKNFEIKKIVL